MIQCPEGAITRTEAGYVIQYEKCTGCRVCVQECPTSAIEMPAVGACVACGFCLKRFECPSMVRGEDGRVKIDRLTCVDCGLCLQVCCQEGIYQSRMKLIVKFQNPNVKSMSNRMVECMKNSFIVTLELVSGSRKFTFSV